MLEVQTVKDKYEHHRLPIFSEKVFKEYHCRQCGQSFIPYARDVRKNHQLPKKCSKCYSRKWMIPVKYTETCIRCGHFWDKRDYTKIVNRNFKCPKCDRKDYRREDWEQQINYKKDIKEEEKLEKLNQELVDRTQELKDMDKVRFVKSIPTEKKPNTIFDRLAD